MPLIWKGARLGGTPTCPCGCGSGDPANPCNCSSYGSFTPGCDGLCNTSSYSATRNINFTPAYITSSGSERFLNYSAAYGAVQWAESLAGINVCYYPRIFGDISVAGCICEWGITICSWAALSATDPNHPEAAKTLGGTLIQTDANTFYIQESVMNDFNVSGGEWAGLNNGSPVFFCDAVGTYRPVIYPFGTSGYFSSTNYFQYADPLPLKGEGGANVFPMSTGYDPAVDGINLILTVGMKVGKGGMQGGCGILMYPNYYLGDWTLTTMLNNGSIGTASIAGCDCCSTGSSYVDTGYWHKACGIRCGGSWSLYRHEVVGPRQSRYEATGTYGRSGWVTITASGSVCCLRPWQQTADVEYYTYVAARLDYIGDNEEYPIEYSSSTPLSITIRNNPYNMTSDGTAGSYTEPSTSLGIINLGYPGMGTSAEKVAVNIRLSGITAIMENGTQVSISDKTSGAICVNVYNFVYDRNIWGTNGQPSTCAGCLTASSESSSITIGAAGAVGLIISSVDVFDMFDGVYTPSAGNTPDDTLATNLTYYVKVPMALLTSTRATTSDAWGFWEVSSCSSQTEESAIDLASAIQSGSYVKVGAGYLPTTGPGFGIGTVCAPTTVPDESTATIRRMTAYGELGTTSMTAAVSAANTTYP